MEKAKSVRLDLFAKSGIESHYVGSVLVVGDVAAAQLRLDLPQLFRKWTEQIATDSDNTDDKFVEWLCSTRMCRRTADIAINVVNVD